MVAIAVKVSEQMLNIGNAETTREHEIMHNESHHLVIGAEDMLRIREKIQNLYPGKNVILAPCLSKLYISRELKMFDFDGKTSPNWFYFSTGIVALIYNTDDRDLSIALFDEKYVRLLWCLKWADYIELRAQTSQFYVLNTKEDLTNHAGILYDNKDVAELMRSTIEVLYENMKPTVSADDTDDSSKSRMLRNLSLRRNKPRAETMPVKPETTSDNNNGGKTKFFSRESLRRRTGLLSKSKHSSFEDSQIKCTVVNENDSTVNTNKFSRAQSFRKSKTSDNIDNIKGSEKTEMEAMAKKELSETDNDKETIRKRILKLRRISRTRSLITPKIESQVTHEETTSTQKDKYPDANQVQRTKKIVKQRASTDTLILHDKTMRYVIDAAHVARFARERKYFLKTLERTNLQDTDLCTTEL